MSARRMGTVTVAALALACGGNLSDPMEYGGHTLEPASVVFAHVPVDGAAETVLLFSDRADACAQFDGLGCLDQPFLDTSLFFRFDGFDARTYEVGDELAVRWLDFQGVRPLQGDATSGRLVIEVTRMDEELSGNFDVELPEGRLKNIFTAKPCKPLRDYFLTCRKDGT